MKKKNILKTVFVLLHIIATRYIIRIVDATVKIDDNYIALIALIIVINIVLYFIFRKIYKLVNRKH